MIEDSALTLKKAYEKGENITIEEAQKMLFSLKYVIVFVFIVKSTN